VIEALNLQLLTADGSRKAADSEAMCSVVEDVKRVKVT